MHRATIYRWPCITRVITFRTVRTCNEENIDSENFTNNFETRWTNTTRADKWIEKFHEFCLLDKRRKNSSLCIRYLKKFQSWRNNFSSKKERRIIFKIQTSISNAIERRLKKFFHKEKKKRNKSAISLSQERDSFSNDFARNGNDTGDIIVLLHYITIYALLIEALARHVWTEFSRDGVISDQTSIKVETRCRAALVYHPPREPTRINFPRT